MAPAARSSTVAPTAAAKARISVVRGRRASRSRLKVVPSKSTNNATASAATFIVHTALTTRVRGMHQRRHAVRSGCTASTPSPLRWPIRSVACAAYW